MAVRDDGGLRAESIAFQGGNHSPEHAFASTGSPAHAESLSRHSLDEHTSDDKRRERRKYGHVPFRTESHVPDVGGLGWRTKYGHMLKNQVFYSQKTKVNKWDDPTFAGVNTWKEWHGPKLRTDADAMERLDRLDAEADDWEAKKTFVNTNRVQTLDRFYNRKLNRTQLESSGSWAPQGHPRREVHSIFETFDSCLDEKPVKEIKKVLTPFVLKRDREAIRMIAKRLQNEETWKERWKDYEQERRADIRADFQQRQAHVDGLMLLSGQPVLERNAEDSLEPISNLLANSLSSRGAELSRPKGMAMAKHVTSSVDFRGLVHADNEHALEALFPGSGHELSMEFRDRVTRSVEPRWPPPPRATTPEHHGKKKPRETEVRKEAQIAAASIPVPVHRLANLGSRRNDAMLARHAKAQFLTTSAPPAPQQSQSLLSEDWSRETTLWGGRCRVTGDFNRTNHVNQSKSSGHLPPPNRSPIYPMLVPTSQLERAPRDVSHMSSLICNSSGPSKTLSRNGSAPAVVGPPQRRRSEAMKSSANQTRDLCAELDEWESSAVKVPGIDNFFGVPHPSNLDSSQSR